MRYHATRPLMRRMQAIDRALRAGRWPTDKSLAKELNVDPRTIRRNLEFMRGEQGRGERPRGMKTALGPVLPPPLPATRRWARVSRPRPRARPQFSRRSQPLDRRCGTKRFNHGSPGFHGSETR